MPSSPEWIYSVHTAPLPDRDAVALKAFRYSNNPDAPGQEYLTDHGWKPYDEFEQLTDLIVIPGNQLVDREGAYRAANAAVVDAIHAGRT